MAINLDFKDKEVRQKIMTGVLIIVLAITFIVLYTYFFRAQNVIIPLPSKSVSPGHLLAVRQRSLNTEILSGPVFQSLKKFGDYPVDVKDSDLGRENPFVPF